MLSLVMENNKPKEWEDASYENKTYQVFDLAPNDPEFINISKPFYNGGLNIRTLRRVQNPFQLGRFTIRKEQFQHRKLRADKMIYYHPLHNSDLNSALEFNMDVRRYGHRYCGNSEANKNPKFFKTPGAAAAAIFECSEKIILVCEVLGSMYNEPSTTFKTNDAEYIPTYVVAVRN